MILKFSKIELSAVKFTISFESSYKLRSTFKGNDLEVEYILELCTVILIKVNKQNETI